MSRISWPPVHSSMGSLQVVKRPDKQDEYTWFCLSLQVYSCSSFQNLSVLLQLTCFERKRTWSTLNHNSTGMSSGTSAMFSNSSITAPALSTVISSRSLNAVPGLIPLTAFLLGARSDPLTEMLKAQQFCKRVWPGVWHSLTIRTVCFLQNSVRWTFFKRRRRSPLCISCYG